MALQDNLNRLDKIVDARLSREEQALARDREADAAAARRRADMARDIARADSEGCREYAARYDSVFQAFGTETPSPVDGEKPIRFRARLYERLRRKLPDSHDLADLRADDFGTMGQFDNFEKMMLDAARREAAQPSASNLPPDGSLISRTVTDPDTGEKSIQWHGRESFIRQMSRGGHRVLRVIDPKTRSVLFGAPFSKAE